MKPRLILAAALMAATAAQAEVVERSDAGFRTRNTAEIAATPQRVYAALGEIGLWWDKAHTYGGKASNLSLSLKPGGCFCEDLPGGGVRHGVVEAASPGLGLVRIDAALGPLQAEAATGALTFQIAPKDGGVEIVQTYVVSGLDAARAKAFADPVDAVIGAQLQRLKRHVEGRDPD